MLMEELQKALNVKEGEEEDFVANNLFRIFQIASATASFVETHHLEKDDMIADSYKQLTKILKTF